MNRTFVERAAFTVEQLRTLRRVLFGITVIVVGVSPPSSFAHTMADVEAGLEAGEPAAEVVDESMPDFLLEDREGSAVRLTEFHGKVVVLSIDGRGIRGGSCATDKGAVADARVLVAEIEGLDEQLQFITVIAGGRTNQKCEEGAVEFPPRLVLYPRRGAGVPGSQLVERLGFGSNELSGTLIVGPSGRLQARFRGREFAPVQLLMYVAALAHGEHGDRAGADISNATTKPDGISLRLLLGGVFALSGALAFGLYTHWQQENTLKNRSGAADQID